MLRKCKFIAIIILLSFFILNFKYINVNAYSNEINRNFKRITIDDGLSQSTVKTMFQDSKGYIWIGTDDGLNKYNGDDIKIYKHSSNKNTLSGNSITDIKEDKEGNLWIGTKTGLNKMDRQTEKVTRYLPDENNCKISHFSIRKIMITNNGNILVGTENGLNKYDKENDNFTRIYNSKDINTSLINQDIYDLDEDIYGNYWVGTKGGLNKINIKTGKVYKYIDNTSEERKSAKNFIYSLHADNRGYLWVGTHYGGLKKLNISKGTWEKFYPDDKNNMPGANIRDILRDSRGYVWVATNTGFTKLNEEEGKFITYKSSKHNTGSIISDDILCITEDKTGTILVGTKYGISLFNPENLFNYYKSDPFDDNSLSSDSISGIYEDNDGILWVGTFNHGLNIIDRKKDKVIRIDDKEDYTGELRISSNIIRDITGIGNEIWISTENGLNKYDKGTDKITSYKKEDGLACTEIKNLLIDKDGTLWIGTIDGLYTYDRKNKFKDYSKILKDNGVKSVDIDDLIEDDEGLIWIITSIEDGLISLDKSNNEVKIYNSNTKEEFNSDKKYIDIISLNVDDYNNIWLATDSGLIKFNKESKTYKKYTEEDGLPNSFIYGILFENSESLWVSTNYGLSNFNIKDEKFMNYNSADGLQGNEFNQYSYYKSKNGEMFFGGTNGLTSFIPMNIKENEAVNSVQIESINTNFGTVKIKDSIVLNYKNDQLKLEFFLPDYRDEKKIKYKYKLEGLDSEWSVLEHTNSTNYSNVKPGNYTFTVVAKSSNGQWSEPTSIKIKIKNPPWSTPIAYFIYILIIVGIVYVIWNRVKLLDRLVKERTLDLNEKLEENERLYIKLLKQEKYKNNYFINLSHELRTPLNIISATQNLIESFNKQNKKISKEKMSYYTGNINKNCKRLANLIDNIVDTSKIESESYILNIKENDIVYLVEETALSMRELIDKKGIDLIIEPYIEEKIVECDGVDIERVIINLISNAIKFTNNGGYIKISLWDLGEYVKISVKDNGIGIDPKNHELVFDRFSQAYSDTSEIHGGSGLGLTLSKQLIELHGGEIWVESELGKGSEFIIILPQKQVNKFHNNVD